MNRLKDKIKKKWKTMAGMTVMLMFVFVVGFAAKAHFTSRAADDDRDYVVLDSTGRQMTSGQEYTMRRKQDQLSASGAQDSNTTYTWQDEPCAALDGNVFRVLSRLYDLDTPIDTTSGRRTFAALADSLIAMLKDGVHAVIRKDSYPVPPIFGMMQKKGQIEEQMMYNTFNMGIGMIVAVDPADAEKAMEAMRAAGDTPYIIGSIEAGEKGVTLC